MTNRQIERVCWTAVGVAALLAVVAARAMSRATGGAPPAALVRVDAAPSRAIDSLDRWARTIIEHDPFQLDHTASEPPVVLLPVPPPRVRPQLVLVGITGGPPWHAVVEGLPGTSAGSLAREGQMFGAFIIRRITADTVVVAGDDTTWTLTLRVAWH